LIPKHSCFCINAHSTVAPQGCSAGGASLAGIVANRKQQVARSRRWQLTKSKRQRGLDISSLTTVGLQELRTDNSRVTWVTHREALATPGGREASSQVIEGHIEHLQAGEGLCLAAPRPRQAPIQQIVCQPQRAKLRQGVGC